MMLWAKGRAKFTWIRFQTSWCHEVSITSGEKWMWFCMGL